MKTVETKKEYEEALGKIDEFMIRLTNFHQESLHINPYPHDWSTFSYIADC